MSENGHSLTHSLTDWLTYITSRASCDAKNVNDYLFPKMQYIFPKKRQGGCQMPFGVSPKIHPFWRVFHFQVYNFLNLSFFTQPVSCSSSRGISLSKCTQPTLYSNAGWFSVKMYFESALATDVQTLITGWLLPSAVHDQIYHQHFVIISSYCHHILLL